MTQRILLLSGYDAASHRRWREQLVTLLPGYHWQTLALPPRFFQWRIRGNPVSWLDEPCLQESWDLVIATSMVDLATLRGLHPSLANTPCLLYMHENQFAFPVSDQQRGRVEPQMVISTARWRPMRWSSTVPGTGTAFCKALKAF